MKPRLKEIKEQGAPQPVSGAIGSEPVGPQTEKHCASLPTPAHVLVPSYRACLVPRLPSPLLRALREGPQPQDPCPRPMYQYYACRSGPCGPLLTGPLDQESWGSPCLSGPVYLLQVLVGPRGHGQTPAGKEQGPRLPLSWLGKWASSIWASLGGAGERSLSSTSLHAPSFSLPVLSLRLGLDLHHPILFITRMSTP